jgi:phosphoenolpyruvate phosphomutase
MSPGKRLKDRLAQPGPLLVGGAHDALSAKLVAEAGFDAVWASGFEISASHGVPDANILTMTDNLQAAARMARAVEIPIIADCDNGYGNAINVIYAVQEYEREGIAGICIEDNVFPKRCSFYAGVKRELADVEEHVGKIQACVRTRRSPDFAVIARTEALIAGWGMEEALTRGRAYADAGADLVLIHSKSESPDEVLEFARRWDRTTPLVCVPTIYRQTTARELADAGFKVVIYANHGLRSSIRAMRQAFARLKAEQKCAAVDDLVVPLEDVYDLIGVSQMKKDEKSFLPAGGRNVSAVVLAAGASPELGTLTADRPKAMLDIKGRSLLEHQVEALNGAGIKDIAVVLGWKKEAVTLPNLKRYVAPAGQGEVSSLLAAAAELKRRCVVLYGDILFDKSLLERLLTSEGDVVMVVDRSEAPERPLRDLVETAEGHAGNGNGRALSGRTDTLKRVGRDLPGSNGEWIGMLMLSEQGVRRVLEVVEELKQQGGPVHQAKDLASASLTDLLQACVSRGVAVRTIDTFKGWMEIDTFEDYRRAWAQVS